MKVVYHGSENGNLEKIEANNSTHQKNCIYAAEDPVIAMVFMAKWSDLDFMLGTINGELVLVERRPEILNSIYNKDGYIYSLDGSTFSHYDYLWSKEVISFESNLIPLSKTYHKNILSSLEQEEAKGNIKIFRYPNRPKNIPLDNSDLIDKYINFEHLGLTGAIKDLLSVYPEFTKIVEEKLKPKKNKNLEK